MAPRVTHAYTSAVADQGDVTLVQPTDWNADHVVGLFNATPPTWNGDTGAAGEMAYDSANLYICVATNTWIQIAGVTSFGPAAGDSQYVPLGII